MIASSRTLFNIASLLPLLLVLSREAYAHDFSSDPSPDVSSSPDLIKPEDVAEPVAPGTRFNASFLSFGSGPKDVGAADLDIFSTANVALPGTHLVDIEINSHDIGQHEIDFVESGANAGATPCITSKLL